MRHPGDTRRPVTAAVCAVAVAALALTGCSPADTVRGCSTADEGLVEKMTAAGRTGTSGPGDLDVDRVEVGKTITIDLPERLRKFGADRLLASRASVYDADPPSEDFPGIETNAFVAISSDDELVAPIGKVTDVGFDIPGPDDPSWKDWAEEVEDSHQAAEAQSCIDPNA